MIKIDLEDIPVSGLPLYKLQQVFNIKGDFSSMTFSVITLLPGQRIPHTGTSCHEEDEYSIFIEGGGVYTESGDYKGICGQGEATLIPKGEAHWSENRSNEDCKLVCVMLK